MKADVEVWEDVADYVFCGEDDDLDGMTVYVQVGHGIGGWYLRTAAYAGDMADDAPDTAYRTQAAARRAAVALAKELAEACS
jgi:hypothetical protein